MANRQDGAAALALFAGDAGISGSVRLTRAVLRTAHSRGTRRIAKSDACRSLALVTGGARRCTTAVARESGSSRGRPWRQLRRAGRGGNGAARAVRNRCRDGDGLTLMAVDE